MESSAPQCCLAGEPCDWDGAAGLVPGTVAVGLEVWGFRPNRRWLITALEGLSWEVMRVVGHLSEREKGQPALKASLQKVKRVFQAGVTMYNS